MPRRAGSGRPHRSRLTSVNAMPRGVLAKVLLMEAVVLMMGMALTVPQHTNAQPQTNPQGVATSPTGPSQTPQGPSVVTPPSTYLANLYLWFLGFVGIAALFAFVRGGVAYMFGGVSPAAIGEAKKWISNGIWGIAIAAASYLLLNTINPDLVRHGFNLEAIIQQVR